MTMPRVNWRQKAEWLERENESLKKKLEEKTLENLIREIAREEAQSIIYQHEDSSYHFRHE